MPIDFKKLSEKLAQSRSETPEQKEAKEQLWLEQQPWYQDQKLIEEIYEKTSNSEIPEWDRRFIRSIRNQVCQNYKVLSEKQKKIFDKLVKIYLKK